jgi:iron complex outermembrane receptor protein
MSTFINEHRGRFRGSAGRIERARKRVLVAGLALPLLAGAMGARAQDGQDLADLSIEELANIQVTSVSKRPERLQDAPAAVFVIGAEDIRRSGADTLPEALRLAPNLHVARINGYGYSISARGLNSGGSVLSNKLLVLIDGRSVYTPLFSGVFWDAQDVVLEDIERIEVVSGPGGVLWGLNAVNGVINIITRSAQDTQGSMLALHGANDGSAGAAFRQGGITDGGVAWRAFGQYGRRSDSDGDSDSDSIGGGRIDDRWRRTLAGARADWERGSDRFTLLGNVYQGRMDQPAPGELATPGGPSLFGRVRSDGANATLRWQRALDDGGALAVQAYLDHTLREAPPLFAERLTTADVQLQHTLPAYGRHALVWGANARVSRDRVDNSPFVAFLPADTTQRWASLFVQDEIALRDDWRLVLGGRAEYNHYTGVEWLPSVRLSWRLSPQHALWASAARTVRAPARIDVDAWVPGQPPYILRGGPQVQGEVARVVELGYRGQPAAALSYSVTLFHHDYDHLRTDELDPTRSYLVFGSLMEGSASGIEAWGSWQPLPRWRLSAGLTALHQRLWLKPGSTDPDGSEASRRDPSHTWQLRSSYNIDDAREVDVTLRRVGEMPASGLDSYTALDARFGWRLRPGLALSVFGENLTGGHTEFGTAMYRTVFERRVGVKVRWDY